MENAFPEKLYEENCEIGHITNTKYRIYISYYESDDKFSQKKLVLFSEIAQFRIYNLYNIED